LLLDVTPGALLVVSQEPAASMFAV